MQSGKIFRAYRHVGSALPIFNFSSNSCTQGALSSDGHIGNFKSLRRPQVVDFEVYGNQNIMSK